MQSLELFQRLLELGREGRASDIAQLPGAGIHREVLELVTKTAMIRFFGELSQVDRVAFIKAVAFYEQTVGGLGSVTQLEKLLFSIDDPDGLVLDWILRNTISYRYYSHGARSLADFRAKCDLIEERRSQAARREGDRQAADKLRVASRASQNLFNAMIRGDLPAVRALLAKGADPYGTSPDGTPLISLALEKERHDIVAALQGNES